MVKAVEIAGSFKKVKTITKELALNLLNEHLTKEELASIESTLNLTDKFKLVDYEGVKTLLFIDRDDFKGFSEDFYIIKRDSMVIDFAPVTV